jgi:hypothetical protein
MVARAVFTALMGGYECLNDAQAVPADVDFLCFTDDPTLTSEVWTIVHVEPEFPGDAHRSQRRLKMMGHKSLAAYDETLYIDNSVSLHGDVHGIFDSWLADADFAVARHSFRDTVADEFAAVLTAGLDDHQRVSEQWDHYLIAHVAALEAPALWGGMIARRWTPDVQATCETWYHHVLRYSRRDQLSITVAIAGHANSVAVISIDNHRSQWHEWPVATRRAAHMRLAASALRTPEGILAIQERHRLEERATQLGAELALARAEVATSRAEIEGLQLQTGRLKDSSWRPVGLMRGARRRLLRLLRGGH